MITRDNPTREQLNHAARTRLKRENNFPRRCRIGHRSSRPATASSPVATTDTSTSTTAPSAPSRRSTPSGGRSSSAPIRATGVGQLDLRYVLQHLEHAYAITGHSSQGSTVENAIVIGRPEAFTREWAYTALSRARGTATIHVITGHDPADDERAEYAPGPLGREPGEALDAVARALRRSDAELLALEQTAAAARNAHARRLAATRLART